MANGKVVVVTGSAKGIGLHIARTFAHQKAKVVLVDVAPLDSALRELHQLGAGVLAVSANITDEESVRAAMGKAAAHFGRIDVLVNNAAVVTHFGWMPLWPRVRDMEKSFWDHVIDTNLGGTFLCCKHVLPYMEAQRSGHIINLGHPGGVRPRACVYEVSKWAVLHFTRFLADEEREFNICVVSMQPGPAMATEEAPPEVRQQMPGPEVVGNRYVLAAQAGMELTGHQIAARDDGGLEIVM